LKILAIGSHCHCSGLLVSCGWSSQKQKCSKAMQNLSCQTPSKKRKLTKRSHFWAWLPPSVWSNGKTTMSPPKYHGTSDHILTDCSDLLGVAH
ncbi:MAG: hypothetical protein ACPGK1_15770, partial [bacterium]